MTLVDEFTRKCVAIRAAKGINAIGLIEPLADAMLFEGIPAYIRTDNGLQMITKVLRPWLAGPSTKCPHIKPRSHRDNGYCESFNGKLKGECLDGEIFYSLKEAQMVIENSASTTIPDGRIPRLANGHRRHSHCAIDAIARRDAKHPLVSQFPWYKISVRSTRFAFWGNGDRCEHTDMQS